jgi:hypothetical protein
VNKKMPNNSTDTKEKMPNNHYDSVIHYERVLSRIAEKRNQINFDSEAGRKMIAEDLTIEIKKEKMPNNNMDLVNNLLDDILNAAVRDDEYLKDYWVTSGQGEKTVGESFVVYHLKVLKKLLNE